MADCVRGRRCPGAEGAVPHAGTLNAQSGEGDAAVLSRIAKINQRLATTGLNIAVEQIEFFTIGGGRPSNRIHQQGFRWVANDPRRFADGERITYLVDQSEGATASGVSSAQTEAAIDRAMTTWQAERCLRKVDIVKLPESGADPDIFDSFFGFGDEGNPFLADIVEAGWLPRAFFEAVGGPGGGQGILAFTVTFIFTDDNNVPTDLNGDRHSIPPSRRSIRTTISVRLAATAPEIRGGSMSRFRASTSRPSHSTKTVTRSRSATSGRRRRR